jgi:hypothetical protein
MAIDWGAFVKGFAGKAADQIEQRSQDERDALMEEKRMALREKYAMQEEERRNAREDAKSKKKVDANRSSYDYATGEKVLVNEDGEEIGRVSDPTIAEDRQWSKEERELRRRQAEASIGASNRSGRGGYGGGGGDDTPTDKSRNRVEGVLTKIDARLEDLGAPPAERLAARQAVLKKVASGQSIDQAWLDRYESNLIGGFQKEKKLDQWGAEKIKRDAAAAALKE